MRKITVMNRISVDGYFASLNEASFGMDWFIHDPEVDRAVRVGNDNVDSLIMGRVTYQGFERAWIPVLHNPDAPREMRNLAEELTGMTKYVFTHTLEEAGWENTRLVHGNLPDNVRRIKNEEGGNILIFGSGQIIQQLASERLIDEYMLIITPLVAGKGKVMFKDVKQFGLTPIRTQAFESGNVLLHYALK